MSKFTAIEARQGMQLDSTALYVRSSDGRCFKHKDAWGAASARNFIRRVERSVYAHGNPVVCDLSHWEDITVRVQIKQETRRLEAQVGC